MPSAAVPNRSLRAQSARAARREEILDAARRVFARRGFKGTTIADIADEAKIALGTIYLYFPSKDDLFAALNQRLAELIAGASANAGTGPTLEATTRAQIANIFAACAANRDLVRLVVLNADPETAAAKAMRKAEADRNRTLARALKRGMEAGTVRRGDAAVMADLVRGAVSIAVYQAFVIADGTDADTYRDACADMLVAYLSRVDPESG